ncbi:hypothetical protein MPH_13314 [Macrophomina phaseolina MS6]|uniref:Zn(2)-C6 fungal-type domain-containing protein n=1 Tax=Macrophomina phaseolina (strain MS6) TaxID=1126212 RepID=K2QIJ4_MACPH|nr:hypothetical protein MPH_13314 [Macrophomina phaseolina MS6]
MLGCCYVSSVIAFVFLSQFPGCEAIHTVYATLDTQMLPSTPSSVRLRLACDSCHGLKVRCSGTLPCEACADSGSHCFYSIVGRLGRPKGSKTKRSREQTRSEQQKAKATDTSQGSSTIAVQGRGLQQQQQPVALSSTPASLSALPWQGSSSSASAISGPPAMCQPMDCPMGELDIDEGFWFGKRSNDQARIMGLGIVPSADLSSFMSESSGGGAASLPSYADVSGAHPTAR